jgi:hypothetical protein
MAKRSKKRRSAKRKHRKTASNPKRSHARRTHRRKRARASNPRRSHRRTHRRHRASNPRRHHRRKHRNPGKSGSRKLGKGALVGFAIAGVAGVLAYLATIAGTYFVTKDMLTQGPRNRKIAGLAVAAAGVLAFGKKKPLVAAALAAGGLLGAFADQLTLKLIQYLPAKSSDQQQSAVYANNMRAVFANDMRGLVPVGQMNAVYANNMRGLGASYGQIGNAGMGALVPRAPWENPGPFG